jgi:hypothetical protein
MSDSRQRRSGLLRTCTIALFCVIVVLGSLTTAHRAFSYSEFIQDAVEPAQMSQRETGVPASVTIAQAIEESQWGDKHIGDANNYFGIKAHQLADGSIYVGPVATGWVWADTTEYENGQSVQRKARFRKYASMTDSFTDHGYFLWENDIYHPAFQAETDPRKFARQIAAAGYATDPNYANRLIALMDQNNLFQYDVPGEAPPGEDVPGIVIDDKGGGIERGGTADFWKELGVGYKRHSYWTFVARSDEDNWLRWRPSLSESGIYEVLVYIPPLKTTTKQASYLIRHAGAEDTVEVSQRDHPKQWVTLGEYIFAAEGDEFIRLSDVTGEKSGSATIAFDAVRLVRIGKAPSPFDAAMAGSPDFVIAHAGEAVKLQIEAENTGLQTWKVGQVVLTNVKRPLDASKTHPLREDTPPGKTATWSIDVKTPRKPGVYQSDWQLEQGDKKFGSKLSAYLIVLPEGASELEQKIKEKIEEWRQAGEEQIDKLVQEIVELIEKEVQSFLEKLIANLRKQLCGASALILLGILLFWWHRL